MSPLCNNSLLRGTCVYAGLAYCISINNGERKWHLSKSARLSTRPGPEVLRSMATAVMPKCSRQSTMDRRLSGTSTVNIRHASLRYTTAPAAATAITIGSTGRGIRAAFNQMIPRLRGCSPTPLWLASYCDADTIQGRHQSPGPLAREGRGLAWHWPQNLSGLCAGRISGARASGEATAAVRQTEAQARGCGIAALIRQERS